MSITSIGAIPVTLNVYDLVERQSMCFGVYHTGVEIMGVEYSFGSQCGIYECEPKVAQEGKYAGFVDMGKTEINMAQVLKHIDNLRLVYTPDSYDIISRNCNHFCDDLCKLLVKTGIPNYINRLSRWGKYCSCLIPRCLLGNSSAAPACFSSSSSSFVLFSGEGRKATQTEKGKGDSEPLLSSYFKITKSLDKNENSASNNILITNNSESVDQNNVDYQRELRAQAALKRMQQIICNYF